MDKDTNATLRRDCLALSDRIDRYKWHPENAAKFFGPTNEAGALCVRAQVAIDALRDLASDLLPDAPTPPLTEAQEATEAAARA